MKSFEGSKGIAAALVSGAGLFAVLLFASNPVAAQGKNAQKTNEKKYCIGCSVDGKTTPRTPDGHPDLSGFWGGGETTGGAAAEGGRGSVFQRSDDGSILFDIGTEFNVRKLCHDPILNVEDTCQDPNQPSYKPEYMAKVKELAAQEYRGTTPLDPQMDCRPLGLPRSGAGNMQIFQTPQAVAILYSSATGSAYRIIYTDGRPHPADLETSFMGDSIGHWEGDTLVVDVTGLNDETWLAGGVATTLKYANIHSDQEHVVERYTPRRGYDDLSSYCR